MEDSYEPNAAAMFLAVLVKRLGGEVIVTQEELENMNMSGFINVTRVEGGFRLLMIEDRPQTSTLQ